MTREVPQAEHTEQTRRQTLAGHSVSEALLADSMGRTSNATQAGGDLTLWSYKKAQTAFTAGLPALELRDGSRHDDKPAAQPSRAVHDVTIRGKNGNTDTISGTCPEPGESLPQLIKRLHPNLTGDQLAHQVRQMLKYNRDYGNDLGDGTKLDPSKEVYLCSVKYLDASGRVSRIEGPTGRITELAYRNDGQLAGYKISSGDGSTEEGRWLNGKWIVSKGGQASEEQSVDVDPWGDIIVTDKQGSQFAHLTSGTDIRTTYKDGKPIESDSSRNGQPLDRYDYEYEGSNVKIFRTSGGESGQKVLLTEQLCPEALARLAAARGQIGRPAIGQTHADYEIDLPADGFVAQNIVRAAEGLCGHAVTELDRSIPANVGCARTASEALARAGFGQSIITANVEVLESKLRHWNRGGHFVQVSESQLQPADVIICLGPGPSAGHTAIYAGDGRIMGNSSRKGYFTTGNYEATFGRFAYRVGYRFIPDDSLVARQ